MTVTVLSIDGGGIRGIIPALVLRHVRRTLDDAGVAAPFPSLFDFMAGTSSGGLTVACLAAPRSDPARAGAFVGEPAYSADDVVNVYLRRAPALFGNQGGSKLRRLLQAIHEKYQPRPIRIFLEDLLGEATIKDSLSHLLVPSYDMSAETSYIFKHRPARSDRHRDDPNFRLRDVVLATMAAPTYFPPVTLSPLGCDEPEMCLVDGGVFAANPAMCAYVEARKTFPDAERILILSLGTGTVAHDLPCDRIGRWGYLEWVNPAHGAPITTAMNIGQSECTDHQLQKMPDVDYTRVNGPVPADHFRLDDTSDSNLEALTRAADTIIDEHRDALSAFCESLIAARNDR